MSKTSLEEIYLLYIKYGHKIFQLIKELKKYRVLRDILTFDKNYKVIRIRSYSKNNDKKGMDSNLMRFINK